MRIKIRKHRLAAGNCTNKIRMGKRATQATAEYCLEKGKQNTCSAKFQIHKHLSL